MGLMDKAKDAMDDMSDDMKARFEELKSKEDRNELDDKGRAELQQMRDRMNNKSM